MLECTNDLSGTYRISAFVAILLYTISRLQSFQIYKNLACLNDLPDTEADAVFLACCGSTTWARRMAGARPFPMLEDLFETAENTWASLSSADLLEAFAANPPIGSKKIISMQKEQAVSRSAGTRSGVEIAENPPYDQLVEVSRLYEDKFGFIFIVCASEKTPDEILAICRARLGNSVETELRIATEEQRKITEIRLNKLLER